MLWLEEKGFSFVHRIETDDLASCHQWHGEPTANVTGAVDPLPSMLPVCIRYDHTPFSRTYPPQKGISFDVESYESRGLNTLKSERANDKLRLSMTQHHVRTVIRNKLAEEVEQCFEYFVEAEVLRQGDVGVAKNFSLPADGISMRPWAGEFGCVSLHTSQL